MPVFADHAGAAYIGGYVGLLCDAQFQQKALGTAPPYTIPERMSGTPIIFEACTKGTGMVP